MLEILMKIREFSDPKIIVCEHVHYAYMLLWYR